jgi:hypothetical protein
LAIPKSTIFTSSRRVIITLAGLMSRCTMPASCAAASPWAIWVANDTARSIGSGPRWMCFLSVSPS